MSEPPRIYAALKEVMTRVQAIRKGDTNTFDNYRFRGIDATINAVGPVLREVGVLVTPHVEDVKIRDVQTSQGKPSREVSVMVTYKFWSVEDGSTLEVRVAGEAMDRGDKATPKAMSVAMRTALLQALCIPTDEPDPDSQSFERGRSRDDIKSELWDTWIETGHPKDGAAISAAFNQWSEGGELATAPPSQLTRFIAHLHGTPKGDAA